jgi:flagellar basal-body rod protein FlgG
MYGLYSAAAGMAAQQRRLEAVANDLANLSTHGYKHARVSFRDLIYTPAGRGAANGVSTGAGAAAEITGRSFAQGTLEQTGQPLDLAIAGEGFFQVRRADGSLALTRDGSFRVDAGGQVVTANGARLVPPLTLPRNVSPSELSISADGTVSAGNRRLGRIEVVQVASEQGLLPTGDNLFAVTAASGAARRAGDSELIQGSLEGSNVDMGDAMIDMMDSQRAFQLASRAIQLQDQMLEVANGVKR